MVEGVADAQPLDLRRRLLCHCNVRAALHRCALLKRRSHPPYGGNGP